MYRGRSWIRIIITILVAALILIGILSVLSHMLIPVIVLGSIFLLYKYPPQRWNFRRRNSNSDRKQRPHKNAKFRVIHGNKPDDPEDDLPKYH